MSEPAVTKEYLLSWIRTLTLADHLGDVCNELDELLKRLGVEDEWDELDNLGEILGEKGVKYLHELKD